jgi:hypothetical protein
MVSREINGWKVRVFRQIMGSPWCAWAEKTIDGVKHIINKEGKTKQHAIGRMKKRLKGDNGEPPR